MGGIGLEHHQSSENGIMPGYFTEWDRSRKRGLLPHELAHSWNGKFRRPAGLDPELQHADPRSLLWVYEGQTQYWGGMLGARSGMSATAGAGRARGDRGRYETRAGAHGGRCRNDQRSDHRGRRPCRGATGSAARIIIRKAQLIWLDVDTKIRELSGQKSLDDFSRAFFGIDNGSMVPATYSFEESCDIRQGAALDWAHSCARASIGQPRRPARWHRARRLEARLFGHADGFLSRFRNAARTTDLTYWLGLTIGRNAKPPTSCGKGPRSKRD